MQSDAKTEKRRPIIDLTPALGEAGHEQELLGYTGVADTGPLVDDHGDDHDSIGDRLATIVAPYPVD